MIKNHKNLKNGKTHLVEPPDQVGSHLTAFGVSWSFQKSVKFSSKAGGGVLLRGKMKNLGAKIF